MPVLLPFGRNHIPSRACSPPPPPPPPPPLPKALKRLAGWLRLSPARVCSNRQLPRASEVSICGTQAPQSRPPRRPESAAAWRLTYCRTCSSPAGRICKASWLLCGVGCCRGQPLSGREVVSLSCLVFARYDMATTLGLGGNNGAVGSSSR